MLQPYNGRVYDPAMGSGGFFVSSDRFIEEHAGEKQYNAAEQKRNISVYGQSRTRPPEAGGDEYGNPGYRL